MSSLAELNSPLQIDLSKDIVGAPPGVVGYLEDIYKAFYQIQLAFVQYCGIAPQPVFDWPQLRAKDSIFQTNMNRLYIKAQENLPENALVNIYEVSGELSGRLANATDNTKPCWAICNTPDGIPVNEWGEVIMMQGLKSGFVGLTANTPYYLSTTDGTLTNGAPASPGNIEQFVGVALASDTLYFNSGPWIQK